MKPLLPRLLAMFLLLIALASFAADKPAPRAPAPSATAPTTSPAKPTINWDAAKDHVGESLTVVGPVISTHITRGGNDVVLNVGKDFPDPARFTVYLPLPKDAPAPDTVYKGKTISVTGRIVLYRNVPEIKTEAKDIVFVK